MTKTIEAIFVAAAALCSLKNQTAKMLESATQSSARVVAVANIPPARVLASIVESKTAVDMVQGVEPDTGTPAAIPQVEDQAPPSQSEVTDAEPSPFKVRINTTTVSELLKISGVRLATSSSVSQVDYEDRMVNGNLLLTYEFNLSDGTRFKAWTAHQTLENLLTTASSSLPLKELSMKPVEETQFNCASFGFSRCSARTFGDDATESVLVVGESIETKTSYVIVRTYPKALTADVLASLQSELKVVPSNLL